MSIVEAHTQISADEIARTFEAEAVPKVDLSPYAFEDWVALAIFWIMALCVFLQFFTRYVLNDSYAWTEEIATYCLIGVVFIGAAMCVRPIKPAPITAIRTAIFVSPLMRGNAMPP